MQNKIDQCIEVLESLVNQSENLVELTEEQRIALMRAAGALSRPSKFEAKIRNKKKNKVLHKRKVIADRASRSDTGIRRARENSVFVAPEKMALLTEAGLKSRPELKVARNCYVCKVEYTRLHFFYDSMCTSCGDYNYHKRFQVASLEGKTVLITGARLKIGYQAVLLMLKSGAQVVATTRFPVDAALRFSREPDYENWKNRLQIFGLDLRHTPSVEIFTRHFEKHFERLDILINNAAQTVRRPPAFYSHLMANEMTPLAELPASIHTVLKNYEDCKMQLQSLAQPVQLAGEDTQKAALAVSWHNLAPGIGIRAPAQLSQIPYSFDNSLSVQEVFPEGHLDADLQQVDLRTTNSWRYRLGEVPTPELLEVQLVNAVAPFILCSRLSHMMRRDNTGQKHIVNVTAMEGKFYRFSKPDRHPHTNMAKAALNMLTHTSASDLAKDGIYMNAVDTGWVTDEDPAQMTAEKQAVHDFQPPLDIVDGAARICDPFFDGILTGKHWCGKFLKDYMPIDW